MAGCLLPAEDADLHSIMRHISFTLVRLLIENTATPPDRLYQQLVDTFAAPLVESVTSDPPSRATSMIDTPAAESTASRHDAARSSRAKVRPTSSTQTATPRKATMTFEADEI